MPGTLGTSVPVFPFRDPCSQILPPGSGLALQLPLSSHLYMSLKPQAMLSSQAKLSCIGSIDRTRPCQPLW